MLLFKINVLSHRPQDDCEKRVKSLLKTHLQMSREIPMTKVARLWNGPSFRGFKPVLVAFQVHRFIAATLAFPGAKFTFLGTNNIPGYKLHTWVQITHLGTSNTSGYKITFPGAKLYS
jgi:hypothetical protein